MEKPGTGSTAAHFGQRSEERLESSARGLSGDWRVSAAARRLLPAGNQSPGGDWSCSSPTGLVEGVHCAPLHYYAPWKITQPILLNVHMYQDQKKKILASQEPVDLGKGNFTKRYKPGIIKDLS